MIEADSGQVGDFLDTSLEKAEHIEQAFGHLAKAVELQLVDVALDPGLATDDKNREKFITLGQKIADMSGVGYELLADIANATGIPLLPDQETLAADLSPSSPETDRLPDLYARIIDPAQLPEVPPVEEAEAINAEILTDDTIRFGEHAVTLKGHALFIFNALLISRGKPRSGKVLKELGFFPDAKSTLISRQTFSRSVGKLVRQVNEISGTEVVRKTGDRSGTRYELAPGLVVSDSREDATPEGVKKN